MPMTDPLRLLRVCSTRTFTNCQLKAFADSSNPGWSKKTCHVLIQFTLGKVPRAALIGLQLKPLKHSAEWNSRATTSALPSRPTQRSTSASGTAGPEFAMKSSVNSSPVRATVVFQMCSGLVVVVWSALSIAMPSLSLKTRGRSFHTGTDRKSVV